MDEIGTEVEFCLIVHAKTNYIRKVFDICTRQAKSRNWNELGLAMKDKVLRFEVLSEDEWEAKLNGMLVE